MNTDKIFDSLYLKTNRRIKFTVYDRQKHEIHEEFYNNILSDIITNIFWLQNGYSVCNFGINQNRIEKYTKKTHKNIK